MHMEKYQAVNLEIEDFVASFKDNLPAFCTTCPWK